MRLLIAIGCIAMASVACYGPSFQEGLPCSTQGECPEGYVCAADGKCYSRQHASADTLDEPVPDAMGEPSPDALDTTPPAPIADLAAEAVTLSSVELSWTAPGGDGLSGVASRYDLRYSTTTITAGNWASATPVSGEPPPQSAGRAESFTVTGLAASTTYYFAIKTEDEAANRSEVSNVATATTDSPPPPAYVGTAAFNTEVDGTDSVELGYTVPPGSNRLLIVVTTAEGDSDCDPVAPSSVSYGGVGLTKLAQATKSINAHVSMWYLIAPAEGSAQVVATWSCYGGDYAAAAYSYVGVNQTTPFGPPISNYGSGDTASVVVASAAGELVVDGAIFRFGSGTGLPSAGGGQVYRVFAAGPEADAGTVWTRTLASERAGDDAGVLMTWSVVEPHQWAIVSASLKPALN